MPQDKAGYTDINRRFQKEPMIETEKEQSGELAEPGEDGVLEPRVERASQEGGAVNGVRVAKGPQVE